MSTTAKVLISLPAELKSYLDEVRAEDYTAAGYIRGLLEDDRKAWREHQRALLQDGPKPPTAKRGSHHGR